MLEIAGKRFESDTAFAAWCVETGNLHLFYTWSRWLRLREAVLAADRWECQYCKAKGRYQRAALVHHVNHVRRHPELALSLAYTDAQGNSRRQLVSCCHACHERQHPERMKKPSRRQLTAERW